LAVYFRTKMTGRRKKVSGADDGGIRMKKSSFKSNGWSRLVEPTLVTTEIIQKSIDRFDTFRDRLHVKMQQNQHMGEELMPRHVNPGLPIVYLKQNGRIPEFERHRSMYDKWGAACSYLRPCPYKLTPHWSVMIACNRLTVINDHAYDGHLRPAFTLFNIDKIPAKSQMDLFKKMRQPRRYLTCADWLGSEEEVQLVCGDVRGLVQRCELHQRVVIQFWCPWGMDKGVQIKLIRCHYKHNIIAILGSNNEVNIYSVTNLRHTGEKKPYFVAKCEVKPKIQHMEWFGNKLIFSTETELWEFNVDSSDLLKREVQLHKKPIEMKFKKVYEIDGVSAQNPILSFHKFDDDTFLLGFKRHAKFEEHKFSKKKRMNTFEHHLLSEGAKFALHPTKRIVAVTSQSGIQLLDYKSGRLVQDLSRGSGNVNKEPFIFWSIGHPDTLLQFWGNRIVRYCVKGDRVLDSKPTPIKSYYSEEHPFPFVFRYDAMDNTNIDHDHRESQSKFGSLSGVEPNYAWQKHDEHCRKRNKVIAIDAELAEEKLRLVNSRPPIEDELEELSIEPKRENSTEGRKEVKRPKVDQNSLEVRRKVKKKH